MSKNKNIDRCEFSDSELDIDISQINPNCEKEIEAEFEKLNTRFLKLGKQVSIINENKNRLIQSMNLLQTMYKKSTKSNPHSYNEETYSDSSEQIFDDDLSSVEDYESDTIEPIIQSAKTNTKTKEQNSKKVTAKQEESDESSVESVKPTKKVTKANSKTKKVSHDTTDDKLEQTEMKETPKKKAVTKKAAKVTTEEKTEEPVKAKKAASKKAATEEKTEEPVKAKKAVSKKGTKVETEEKQVEQKKATKTDKKSKGKK